MRANTFKTILVYFVFANGVLGTVPLFASQNTNSSLRENLSTGGIPRLSGLGTFIRTDLKKALTEEDLVEGKEFKSDRQKQIYLRTLQLTTSLDLSLKQDKVSYTLEKLYFDHDKKRRDYTSLSSAMVEKIRNDPNAIDTLTLSVMAFDGHKSIMLTSSQMSDGTIRSYANIMPHGRIYCPKFHQFGRNEGDDWQRFIDGIDPEKSAFRQSTIDGQIHATVEMAHGGVKVEWVLEPDKDMAVVYNALYTNNQLSQEIICQDYAQTSSGEWFPRVYIDKKYVYVKGERVLTSSETFEAIPGTVDFNIPIEASIFSPVFPEGTEVIDER